MSQLQCRMWYTKYKDLPTKKLWTMYLRRLKGTKETSTSISTHGPLQKIALIKLLKERGEL